MKVKKDEYRQILTEQREATLKQLDTLKLALERLDCKMNCCEKVVP
ncbi:MAG: hypothetical protein LUB61_05525 [Eggerthellaceae bacterium]|nr:hypothetical protein [Eggerthellaceae bacterium]